MGPFAAVAGAVLPSLVSGIIGGHDRKQNNAQSMKAMHLDRSWERVDQRRSRREQLADRKNERLYSSKVTAADRRYAEKLVSADRKYAERLTAKDRTYERATRRNERNYAEKRLANDRKYAEKMMFNDESRYKKDRALMQKLSDSQAERQAASRGIDFQRIRDDAIKAGFNPLTAMQFAGSYSTEVGYHNAGSAYTAGTGVLSGGGYGGGGGGVAPTPVVQSQASPSQVAGGAGYSVGGTGYQSNYQPALVSNQFLAEALDEGISTYFNAVEQRDDVRYQTIADKVAAGQIAREVARQTPRQFGYDLSKVEPYSPNAGFTAPPIRPYGSGVDPVHGRVVDENPVQDVPLTSVYDAGGGTKVRGLNMDVDWSEPVQLANELAMGGQLGLNSDWVRKNVPGVQQARNWVIGQRDASARRKATVRPKVPAGMGTFGLTGTVPRSAYSIYGF